jgi:hypothetical protein
MFAWTKRLVWILGLSVLLPLEELAGTIVSPTPIDKPSLLLRAETSIMGNAPNVSGSLDDSPFTSESGISNVTENPPANPKHSNGILLLLLVVIPVWIILNAITSPEFYDYIRSIYFPEDY